MHVLTDRSAQLLEVSAAGLLLADPRGELRLVAASSEAALAPVRRRRAGVRLRSRIALNEQLQSALNSRVIIEQAKGKLAERLGLDMDQSFKLLRDHARSRNLRLFDLAQAFIDGSEPLIAITSRGGRAPGSPRRRPRPDPPKPAP